MAKIQTLQLGSDQNLKFDTLRLDLIHPVISGNKWYKLCFYLDDAINKGVKEIISFGGPYSNHIIATACISNAYQLKSIGYIRGEQHEQLTPTLMAAKEYGMELRFLSRTEYRNKARILDRSQNNFQYYIPEGGYGELGAKGAATILEGIAIEDYTHIVAAIGSGTMIAGLLNAALPHQKIIGISSQKNNFSLEQEIRKISNPENHSKLIISHDYHFGGFAKHPPELIDFMCKFWYNEKIPTDIVYTGKVFYAIEDLMHKQYFKKGNKILIIHSGGLQGNLSLPKNSLPF